MLNSDVKLKIETLLKETLVDMRPVSGGCINDARILQFRSGNKFFLKINSSNPKNMFVNEANGLKELAKPNVIRIPKVIYVDDELILLEFIESSRKRTDFFEDFGRKFALIHKYNADHFGFYENNYIGSNQQVNLSKDKEKNSWVKFYFNKRLKFQFDLAERNGFVNEELRKAFSKIEDKIEDILQTNEKPSLLHGDLWGGNYIVDENGDACLIDPAVYYGNREADLAMTKLFGGFEDKFYSAYQEELPMEDGWQYRENIYKLYHILNHLNLFGMGYYTQAISLIKYYL